MHMVIDMIIYASLHLGICYVTLRLSRLAEICNTHIEIHWKYTEQWAIL